MKTPPDMNPAHGADPAPPHPATSIGRRLDRRTFLAAAGTVAGAGLLSRASSASVATPGVLASGGLAPPRALGVSSAASPDRSGSPGDPRPPHGAGPDRIGIQLYTVRSLMADDVARTLDALAEIGYQEVEFAGYFGHAPGALAGWLQEAGLEAPAAHVAMDDLQGDGLDAALEAADALGHRWLVLPWLPPEQRTPDGYRAATEFLNAAGETAGRSGVRVAYHNHAFEFEPIGGPSADPNGPTGYDLLLERLDPAFVDLEIDFHWSEAGGIDSLALLRDHPGRFPLCHLKDRDASGRMTDVGAGAIDWEAIFALSDRAGLRHYFVEHDQPADPLASALSSYRFLTSSR